MTTSKEEERGARNGARTKSEEQEATKLHSILTIPNRSAKDEPTLDLCQPTSRRRRRSEAKQCEAACAT